ncbi:MAG: hypothetical protein KJ574_00295 [Nanoarchaeota archaeon]|nr:hypothetical protein [Nanoarchaeota archaeon]
MKLNYWRILICGIIFAVIGQIIHTIGAMITMPYYLMPTYFSVWSKLMMSAAGPPPASFYVYSLLFGLITGLLFAVVYFVLKKSVPGKTAWGKGLMYGFLVFIVGILPGYLSLALLVNLPYALIFEWAVESIVILFLNGMVVSALIK